MINHDLQAQIAGLRNVDPQLRDILLRMHDDGRRTRILIGRDGPTDTSGFVTSSDVPPAASFSVVGQDAHFIIDIINPQNIPAPTLTVKLRKNPQDINRQGVLILHQLRSSTTQLFDASGTTTLYEPSEKLHYDLEIPNQQLYWQLRSSYDGKTWNDWQDYLNPHVCGIQKIDSGLIRTSTTDWINSAATTSSGTSPLSQSGVSTTINVAASSWKVGDQVISFLSGTVNPGSFGTWHVYCVDTNKRGGSVTYLFKSPANFSDLTGQNGIVYFGVITTSGGGGGTGAGGGGGFNPGAGCYGLDVQVRMFDGSARKHRDLQVGDILRGIDDGPEEILSIGYELKPCFTAAFEGGFAVPEVSSEQMWMYDGGGWDKVFDVIVGDRFTVKANGARTAVKLTQRDYAGEFLVVKITLARTRTFWVVTPEGDLGSHNVNKN